MPFHRDDLPPAVLGRFPEHAFYIAQIVAAWNTLDDILAQYFPLLTGMNEWHADLIFAWVLSPGARLDALRAAAGYTLKNNPELLAEFNDVMGDVGGRMKVRNDLAHGVYVVNKKNQLCIMRRKYEYPAHPKSIQVLHVNGLKQELALFPKLAPRLNKLFDAIWNSYPLELKQTLIKIRTLLPPPHPTSKD